MSLTPRPKTHYLDRRVDSNSQMPPKKRSSKGKKEPTSVVSIPAEILRLVFQKLPQDDRQVTLGAQCLGLPTMWRSNCPWGSPSCSNIGLEQAAADGVHGGSHSQTCRRCRGLQPARPCLATMCAGRPAVPTQPCPPRLHLQGDRGSHLQAVARLQPGPIPVDRPDPGVR